MATPQTGHRAVVLLIVCSIVISTLGTAGVAAGTPPEEEPNDSPEEAQEITLGSTITGELPDEADEDWYAFEVEAGEAINLTGDVATGGGVKFDIVNPDGNTVGSTRAKNGSFGTGVTATTSGTYYLHAFYWFGDRTGEYAATVSTFATTDREPNEDRGTATDISPGDTVDDTITIGDTDWYAIDASAGDTINLTVALGPGGGIEFDIVTPGGETIGGVRGSNQELVGAVTARVSGTHYVNVYKMGGDTGADYTMTVRTYETTDREPNEDPGNATRISLNATIDDTISREDTDWYAFDLQAGDSISVLASGDELGGRNVAIQGPELDTLNGSTVGKGPEYMNATANSSGTHYVSVGKSSDPGGDYTLEIRTNGTTGQQADGMTDGDDSADVSDDQSGDGSGGGGPPVGPIALIAVVLCLLVLLYVRRKRDEGS